MINEVKNKLNPLKYFHFFYSVYYKIVFLFMIIFVWFENYELISSNETIYNTFFLVFNYFLLSIIFNYGKLAILFIYFRKNGFHREHQDNLTIGIKRLAFFLNYLIFILLVIHTFVVDVRNLFTSLSIFAVALVLVFKDYISNFLNGLNLMFSKDFGVRDTVKIGEVKGKIVDFTFHNVQLKTESGDIIFISNTNFMAKEITNFSKSSLKNIVVDAVISKKSIKKFEIGKEDFLERLEKKYLDNIVSKDNIVVLYSKLDKEVVTITFEIYLPRYSTSSEKQIKNFILKEIAVKY